MTNLNYINNNNDVDVTNMLRMKRAPFNHLASTLRAMGCLKIPSTHVLKSKWQRSFMFLDITRDFESFTAYGGGRLR
jgi:hypothetical protein